MTSFVRSLFAGEALELLLRSSRVTSVLDVGCGEGIHANILRENGKEVTAISLRQPADVIVDYMRFEPRSSFSAIWASHVLEHQPNVYGFLRKCYRELSEDGILAVTVPPLKHEVVGGHVNLFNSGTLLYNLILSGFDCSSARVSGNYLGGPLDVPYNLSVLVRKKEAKLPRLAMDAGDIELLGRFFPFPVWQGFDGRNCQANWGIPL